MVISIGKKMGVTLLGRHTRPACYQALLSSLKLCEQCGSNSCVCVFFIPWVTWISMTIYGHCDVNGVTWSICLILIGRENFCCALIGYHPKGPLLLLENLSLWNYWTHLPVGNEIIGFLVACASSKTLKYFVYTITFRLKDTFNYFY